MERDTKGMPFCDKKTLILFFPGHGIIGGHDLYICFHIHQVSIKKNNFMHQHNQIYFDVSVLKGRFVTIMYKTTHRDYA